MAKYKQTLSMRILKEKLNPTTEFSCLDIGESFDYFLGCKQPWVKEEQNHTDFTLQVRN